MNLTENFCKPKFALKTYKLTTLTLKLELVYLLTSSMPQRVFVGLRNFKAKLWKEKNHV